jgi:GNAT superfamily N-acetyltransferase
MFRLRPITPDDKGALVRLHARLSEETLRRRYHGAKGELTRSDLAFLTEVDDAEHVALVAVDERGELGAVARVIGGGPESAEVAVVVADDVQGRGLGGRITQAALTRYWERHRDSPVVAYVQGSNRRALRLFGERLGGRRAGAEAGVAAIRLQPAASTAATSR